MAILREERRAQSEERRAVQSWASMRFPASATRPGISAGPRNRSTSLVALRSSLLPPAGLFAEVDAEGDFADDFGGEQRVGGMEAATADVAVEALQFVALEHAGAA
jgi:hypothetical protein